VFWGPLTDVYEDLPKKEGGGDDLILPKQVEDADVAERHKYAERLGPKYSAGIHEPPSMEQTPPPLKKKQTLDTPLTEAIRQQRPKNFTIYGRGVPPPSVEPGV
jgi:hypothetical protein